MLDPDSTSAPSSMPPPVAPVAPMVTPTLFRKDCHIALWRRRPFTEGEEVFVTNPADGVLYFGVVVEVDEDVLQCLVRFGDCTERWSNFWDVRRIGESEPSDGQKWMQQKLQREREQRIRKIQERHRERMRREQEQLTRLSSYEEDVVDDEDGYTQRSEDTNDEDFDDEPEFVDNDDEDEDEIEEDDDEFDDDDYNEDPDFKSAAAVKSAQRISTVKGPPKRKREARQVSRRPRKKLKKSLEAPARPRPPTPERVKAARKELPYEFDSLVWDENHTRNDREKFCYCGENGDWYKRMLQCRCCLQWFHQECLRTSTEQMLFGDRFFDFTCALCGPLSKATGSGIEILVRTDMSYVEALRLVLFHLTVMNSKKFHDVENSVVPFFRRKLKALQGPACRLKLSRVEPGSILNLFAGNKSRFKCGSEIRRRSTFWGLRKVAPPSPANSSNFKCNSKDLVSIGSNKRPISTALPANRSSRGAKRRPGRPPGRGAKRGRGGVRGSFVGDSLENSECNSDDTSSRGTLDSFIPPPKDFEGTNNPFRDLGLFRAPDVTVPPLSKTANGSDAGGGLLMMGCRIGRKPGDIRINKTEFGAASVANGDRSGVGDKENCSKRQNEGGVGDDEVDNKDNKLLSDLKYSLNSYFGAETRITNGGERFQVAARRLTESGDVQHLIEWEQPNPLSPPILSQPAPVPQTTVETIKTEASNTSATANGSNSDSGIASPTNSISSSSSLAASKPLVSATATEPNELPATDAQTSATLPLVKTLLPTSATLPQMWRFRDRRFFLCDII